MNRELIIKVFVWSMRLFPSIKPDRRRQGVAVLCFHDVSDLKGRKFSENLVYDPELFHSLIEKIESNGWPILSGSQLISGEYDKSKFSIVLTFDDAYLGFVEHVLPVLESRKVPAIFFICEKHFDMNAPWWIRIDFFIQSQDFYINLDGIGIKNAKSREKVRNYQDLNTKLKLKSTPEEIDLYLAQLFKINEYQDSNTENFNMKVRDIKLLSSSQYVTLSPHGSNHLSCSVLTKNQIVREFLSSKQFLKTYKNTLSSLICYPYGHMPVFENLEECFLENDFRFAFTTSPGLIHDLQPFDFAVPRIVVRRGFELSHIVILTNEKFLKMIRWLGYNLNKII